LQALWSCGEAQPPSGSSPQLHSGMPNNNIKISRITTKNCLEVQTGAEIKMFLLFVNISVSIALCV